MGIRSLACRRVLVVEDDEAIRHMISSALSRVEGVEVKSVASAAELFALAEDGRLEFDAAFVDVVLPDADGRDLAKSLRAATPHAMIVQMSGAAVSEEDRVSALSVGADYFLSKPFSPGDVVATFGVLTRRAEKEIALVNTLRDAEKTFAEGVGGRVTGEIIHNINNALGIIQMAVRSAAENPARNEHYLDMIGRAAKRLAGCVSSLKSTADGNSGASVRTVIEDEARLRATQKNFAGIEMEFRVDAKSGSFIEGLSESELSQILSVLMTNAADALALKPSGARSISVDCREGDGATLLRVADSGCGMDQETLSRVLTSFSAVSTKATPATSHSDEIQGGEGVGVGYVRRVMRRVGGSVAMSSAPGEGTVVSLTFPKRAA